MLEEVFFVDRFKILLVDRSFCVVVEIRMLELYVFLIRDFYF